MGYCKSVVSDNKLQSLPIPIGGFTFMSPHIELDLSTVVIHEDLATDFRTR